jgi:hypothetical protein
MINHDGILPEKYYRCKITHYDNGLGEMSFWYDEPIGREERREACLYPAPRNKKNPEELITVYADEELAETNAERAQRRAKSKVRKLIMTMKADRMLTLTVRENITDMDEANKLFVRFIKLVHQEYPNWKYVSVAEQQKRGAWHYHIAVSGFQNVKFLRNAWNEVLKKRGGGNIDVTSPRAKGAARNKVSPMIAGYLTKYMTKAFADTHVSGRYRYRSSNGIELDEKTIWLPSQSWRDCQHDAAELMEQLYGQIGSVYFADDWNNGWFASWSLKSSS